MRKVLLTIGLAMLGAMMFASVTSAQPNGPAYDFTTVPNNTRPCPFDLEEVQQNYEREVTCGEGGGYVFAPGGSASPSPTPSASPSAYPSPSASASVSASTAADSQYSAPSLPATGGIAPIGLASTALPVAGGLFAAFAVRR